MDMKTLKGTAIKIQYYEDEGGTSFPLLLSKIMWMLIFILLPLTILRMMYEFLENVFVVIGFLIMLAFTRMIGPLNLVFMDELLARIFPVFRSAVRSGRVPVREFRLQTRDKREYACLLRGELTGASIMEGDELELQGRVKNGTFVVKRGVNLNTNSIVQPKNASAYTFLLFTTFLLIVLILCLTGMFDNYIWNIIQAKMENMEVAG